MAGTRTTPSTKSIYGKLSQIFARTVSMKYTLVTNLVYCDKFNFIADGIFLGIIPLRKASVILPSYSNSNFANMDDQIIDFATSTNAKRPLQLVVSVTESDELEGVGYAQADMVSPADWQKKGIKQRLIETPDFTSAVKNVDELIRALFEMRLIIENDGAFYIHCKAGRSRSFMVLVVYLCIFGINPKAIEPLSYKEATELVVSKRKQVHLDGDKPKKVCELIAHIQKIIREFKEASENFDIDYSIKPGEINNLYKFYKFKVIQETADAIRNAVGADPAKIVSEYLFADEEKKEDDKVAKVIHEKPASPSPVR